MWRMTWRASSVRPYPRRHAVPQPPRRENVPGAGFHNGLECHPPARRLVAAQVEIVSKLCKRSTIVYIQSLRPRAVSPGSTRVNVHRPTEGAATTYAALPSWCIPPCAWQEGR